MVAPPPLPRPRLRTAAPPPLRPRVWRHLTPKDLRKFKNLLFAARTIVEGAYAGRHTSPFRGSSPEFVEYRTYNPGDALETIDWKAYARTDRHYVRLTEKETDMDCHLLLDCSGSMAFDPPPPRGARAARVSKMDYAATLAAALAYLTVKQGDKTSLTLFDGKLRAHVPAGGTFPHLYRMLTEIEKQKPAGATDLPDALQRCYGLFRRRGLLVVISDFYGDPERLFRALGLYLHRRFDAILFHVMHEQEVHLPDSSNLRFVDAESGATLTCDPADLRAAYAERLRRFQTDLHQRAAARRIDYHFTHTGLPYDQVLHRYLLKRSALAS